MITLYDKLRSLRQCHEFRNYLSLPKKLSNSVNIYDMVTNILFYILNTPWCVLLSCITLELPWVFLSTS